MVIESDRIANPANQTVKEELNFSFASELIQLLIKKGLRLFSLLAPVIFFLGNPNLVQLAPLARPALAFDCFHGQFVP